jgi:5-methylthioribose kinase
MMRRILGIAHLAEFECITDPVRRAKPERMALHIGARWVQERETFRSVDDLIGVLLEETSLPTQGQ